MGATLDLYIDTQTGELLQAGAGSTGSLPTLTRNDSYALRLRLLEKKPDGTFDDINSDGASLKAAIGDIEQPPSDGSFKLSCNGITSTAIPYNATAVCVYNAISQNVSTVLVYGDQFLLTASQPNTAMSFFADSYTLFPASTVVIGTRRNPATGINAQQIVRLQKNPAVYSDNFSTSPTTGEIALTKVSDGSASQNETYNLNIGAGVRGGSFSLIFGPNSTTGIAIGISSVTFQQQLGAVTGIGASNISVQDNGKGGYSIQFVGSLKLTNISTALTLDASGVDFVPFKQTTLSLNTSELADLFTEADAETITPTLEIELTQDGTPKTIFQKSVSIRKDLIVDGSFSPSTGAQYYTTTESDARYVSRVGDVGFYSTTPISKPANTSVVSALVNLGLISSTVSLNEQGGYFPTVALTGTAITVTDAINFVLGSTTGNKFGTSTSQKLSFYNATPVSQPTGTNVVSALVNLGLIDTSVTLGTPINVVTDWTGNISATTRTLFDSSGIGSVYWQSRALKTSGGTTAFDWQNGIIGSGGTVVTIANNNISVSGNYYIAMGTGNGAFKTLSTTASLYFGSVGNNSTNSVSVTVTGTVLGDIVLLGFYSSPSSGISFIGHTATTNQIEVDCVNATNSTINPATATYRITVLNYQ